MSADIVKLEENLRHTRAVLWSEVKIAWEASDLNARQVAKRSGLTYMVAWRALQCDDPRPLTSTTILALHDVLVKA